MIAKMATEIGLPQAVADFQGAGRAHRSATKMKVDMAGPVLKLAANFLAFLYLNATLPVFPFLSCRRPDTILGHFLSFTKQIVYTYLPLHGQRFVSKLLCICRRDTKGAGAAPREPRWAAYFAYYIQSCIQILFEGKKEAYVKPCLICTLQHTASNVCMCSSFGAEKTSYWLSHCTLHITHWHSIMLIITKNFV